MGFGSPIASAKRRMAPRSTSWTTGSLSRPMSDLSSMRLLEPARGQVEHGDESLQQDDGGRGVHDGPGGRGIAGEAAAQDRADGRLRVDLDLVALVLGARREDELQVDALGALGEPAQHLAEPRDRALR